ncbi:MAG TPA: hypothetical protein VMH00_00325 [Candidatus Limnocylindrales bacterium]|nr:hypothetical protein [Candidatus Limnocylindrales bacterium]
MVTLKIPPGPRFAPRAASPAPEPIPLSESVPAPVALCESCAYARIIRGLRPGDELISCGYAFPPLVIPFVVTECTDYVFKPDASWRHRQGILVSLRTVAVVGDETSTKPVVEPEPVPSSPRLGFGAADPVL